MLYLPYGECACRRESPFLTLVSPWSPVSFCSLIRSKPTRHYPTTQSCLRGLKGWLLHFESYPSSTTSYPSTTTNKEIPWALGTTNPSQSIRKAAIATTFRPSISTAFRRPTIPKRLTVSTQRLYQPTSQATGTPTRTMMKAGIVA